MRPGLIAAVPLALWFTTACAAGCGDSQLGASAWLIEGSTIQLAFAAKPAPLRVGRHFSLEIVVCAADAAMLPSTLRVDAEMPAHRHGMNYAATVVALGGGRFRADGLMLHMPGRWRFLFDTTAAGAPVRLSRDVELE